jgi:hypothetical protein
MSDTKMTNGLVQTWVPVTDVAGRTHLEAHWTQGAQAAAPANTTHAA